MQTKEPIHDAILLIGPTGSGKTPLGAYAETAGFHGRRCVHFDFGHQLRLAAAGEPPENGLDDDATAHIREVLATGALLENEAFAIAESILRRFIERHAPAPDDIIVLNGLPRHIGQAQRIARLLRVIRVVHLQCPPEVVFARIRHNSGGDRTGRCDDAPAAIRRKLAIFEERTAPLLEHYRRQGVDIIARQITLQDAPTEPHPFGGSVIPMVKGLAEPLV
jgi:adenylate kinase family enzyme